MGDILVRSTSRSTFSHDLEITSISINGRSSTFSYDKSETSLQSLVENSSHSQEAPSYQYYNRWLRELNAADEKAELTIDVDPSTLVLKPEGLGGYEPIVVRIEYELCGSHEGLRFMKTLSSDGQYYSVSLVSILSCPYSCSTFSSTMPMSVPSIAFGCHALMGPAMRPVCGTLSSPSPPSASRHLCLKSFTLSALVFYSGR